MDDLSGQEIRGYVLRERIGAPPGGRVVPDRKKKVKAQKRKPNLEELLGEI